MNRRLPRIAMLCGDGPSSWFMYNALAGEAEVLAVVVERKPPARAMIRHRLRQLGWFAVIGQLAFIAFNRLLARLQRRRIDELILRYGLRADLPPAAITHRVHSVNTAAVRRLLGKLDVDAVVVNGTRIISRAVIECIDRPFINTHVGITPRYRGVHGGYWALVRGDADEVHDHDLGHRQQSVDRRTYCRTDDRGLRDRCVQDPVVAILRRQPGGGAGRTGIGDVLSEQEHPIVGLHRLIQREIQRLTHRHFLFLHDLTPDT